MTPDERAHKNFQDALDSLAQACESLKQVSPTINKLTRERLASEPEEPIDAEHEADILRKYEIGKPMKLLVSNLSHLVTEDDLSEVFSPFGNLQAVELIRQPENQAPTGKAFVTFGNAADAEQAISALHRRPYRVRCLSVTEAPDNVTGTLSDPNRHLRERVLADAERLRALLDDTDQVERDLRCLLTPEGKTLLREEVTDLVRPIEKWMRTFPGDDPEFRKTPRPHLREIATTLRELKQRVRAANLNYRVGYSHLRAEERAFKEHERDKRERRMARIRQEHAAERPQSESKSIGLNALVLGGILLGSILHKPKPK